MRVFTRWARPTHLTHLPHPVLGSSWEIKALVRLKVKQKAKIQRAKGSRAPAPGQFGFWRPPIPAPPTLVKAQPEPGSEPELNPADLAALSERTTRRAEPTQGPRRTNLPGCATGRATEERPRRAGYLDRAGRRPGRAATGSAAEIKGLVEARAYRCDSAERPRPSQGQACRPAFRSRQLELFPATALQPPPRLRKISPGLTNLVERIQRGVPGARFSGKRPKDKGDG